MKHLITCANYTIEDQQSLIYMGFSGLAKFSNIRICGLSGIYNACHYHLAIIPLMSKLSLTWDILTKEIIGHGTKRGGIVLHGRYQFRSGASRVFFAWFQGLTDLAVASSFGTSVIRLFSA
ncbi:hypothetical protein F0562_027945 [Nyssa sinensis]|uniref:Uncharacterized protein n=1 Tax=Nyssa sinensis TaxID=561372 RepID=A0A5J5B8J3_9ASTE|nr:hypothetical protein F0562_027945 [Nyssa sinensis]